MNTKTLEQEIEDLKEELSERDETIAELRASLKESDREVNSLQSKIEKKDEEIEELEQEIEGLENHRGDNMVALNLDTFYWSLENGNLAVQQRVETFVEDLKRMF